MTPNLHEHHTPVTTNGHGLAELDGFCDLTYADLLEEEMAGTTRANNDERISDILEGQHTLTLEIRASNIVAQQQATAINRLVDQLGNGKDKTALPNWLMPIIFTTLIGLISIVYWTVQSKITDLKEDSQKIEQRRMSDTQYWQAQYQHVSEQLAELKGKVDSGKGK